MMDITFSTLRELFGNPQPPLRVTESQFDYLDHKLHKVAKKPWEEISDEDLWYYLHDLCYVDLQPDLFKYLFPVCLHFWYRTLMRDEGADQGDAELHYSLYHGDVLRKMLDDVGREKVYTVIHDGFLHRLDREKALPPVEAYPVFSWILRFNSVGMVFPLVERIWQSWWNMETRGRAICVLLWSSGLIYDTNENPLFWDMTVPLSSSEDSNENDRPFLRENDAFPLSAPWMETNLEFLQRTLSADYLHLKLLEAAEILATGDEHQMALDLAALAKNRGDIIEQRKMWLIEGLRKPNF